MVTLAILSVVIKENESYKICLRVDATSIQIASNSIKRLPPSVRVSLIYFKPDKSGYRENRTRFPATGVHLLVGGMSHRRDP